MGLWQEERQRLAILDGISGVLHPGRMTLVLGPPASGKSSLLKALAGLLTPDRNFKARPPQQDSWSGACSALATSTALFQRSWQASCSMGAAGAHVSSSMPEKRGRTRLWYTALQPLWTIEPSTSHDRPSEKHCTSHMALQTAQVKGKVTYNDRELDRFVVHRTAAFMDQQDEHIPCLTVRETLNFSARCQGSGQRPGAVTSS